MADAMAQPPALPQDWEARQRALADRVEVPSTPHAFQCQPRVLALDIQYVGETAYLGATLLHAGSETVVVGSAPTGAPYVPGAFCFREGPPLIALIQALRTRGLEPDLVFVDGHGIAHPRRIGVASWIGVETGLPTVGCAKQNLIPSPRAEVGAARGAREPVYLGEEVVGWVLRTRAGVKPVYVSPGHLVGVDQAADLVLDLPGDFRIPDPLRGADKAARQRAKSKSQAEWLDLGWLG